VQEKQAARDVKVSRVEISPRDVTLQTGSKVIFAAVAYDKDGKLIPGVKFTWDGSDEDKKRKMSVSPRGLFTSPVPGNYKVTVEALGKKDSVKVTVEGEKVRPDDKGDSGRPDFHHRQTESQSVTPRRGGSIVSATTKHPGKIRCRRTGKIERRGNPVCHETDGGGGSGTGRQL
jgi:hypothetical protein